MAKKNIDSVIKGIGTDIIEIKRIHEAIERHGERFLNRLFTEEEQAYCLKFRKSSSHFAGRFAAKEAILKALGSGLAHGILWKEIEIINNKDGKPEVRLSRRLKGLFVDAQVFLTISHCEDYATATAILVSLL